MNTNQLFCEINDLRKQSNGNNWINEELEKTTDETWNIETSW